MQSPGETLNPLTVTRVEQIVADIRLDIVRDVLPPGSRVTEEALAARYGVSRTPVREALRVLAREALVVHRPNTGWTVASINLDEMTDLYTVRVAMEEQIATRLVHTGSTGALDDLLRFWAEPRTEGKQDIELVFDDERFHEGLAIASNSTVLLPMLRNVNQRLHSLRIRDFADTERIRRTYEQHEAILHSLVSGDERLARSLIRAHIWQSYAFVRASVEQQEATEL